MEYITSNIEIDIPLLPSLLEIFAIFQMRLLYHEHNKYFVEAIQCFNCHKNTGLNLEDKRVE